MDSDQNPARVRHNLAQLQTIACKLEELAEEMSAYLPLTEKEPFAADPTVNNPPLQLPLIGKPLTS